MKIHHIGYLVHDKDSALQQFVSLGYKLTEDWIHDISRQIEIAFVENNGVLVELVRPDDDCTLIGKALRKMRNTPYHICYECEDLDRQIASMREQGWLLSQEPLEAPAISGRRVAFLFGSDMGLIELVEKE